MKKVASKKAIHAMTVSGDDQLVEFRCGALYTTIHLARDMDTVRPKSVFQLIEYFPDKLTKEMFWPETGATTGESVP